MAAFTQAEIDELISCPKEVSESPKKLRLDGAHWRDDAVLVASNGLKGDFAVFFRKSEDFPENFSIGLKYNGRDGRGEIILLRCNGKHGSFNKGFDAEHPHFDFHIHRATEEALDQGYTAEKHAVVTSEFASYEEALQYFLNAVNLNPKDRTKYFSEAKQNTFTFGS